jgi:hypothetical protein
LDASIKRELGAGRLSVPVLSSGIDIPWFTNQQCLIGKQVTIFQWIQPWYGAGKTSMANSRLNIPGKIAWITMEVPGFLTVLYIMYTLPAQLGISQLPWENKAMAGIFVCHSLHASPSKILMPNR